MIVGAMNAVNLTDGLDGLASGSSAFTFAAFTVIGFYQLRHEVMYRNPASLDEAVMAAALDWRLRRLLLVERGTGPDIHG